MPQPPRQLDLPFEVEPNERARPGRGRARRPAPDRQLWLFAPYHQPRLPLAGEPAGPCAAHGSVEPHRGEGYDETMNAAPPALPADDPRNALLARLAGHVPLDDDEARDLAFIEAFVRQNADCLGKANPSGHITASAFVVDPAGRVLMTHHRKLQRWLQLGGHTDPHEYDPADAALREAQEESGLPDLCFHPALERRPLDVDVHRIPARNKPGREEPAHDHLDIRFLLLTERPEAIAISDESNDLRWFPLAEVAGLGVDPALERALSRVAAIVGA